MIRAARSYPAAIGGSGVVATVLSAAALAGSFAVHGEIAIAFCLGAFCAALGGGVLLLGSAKLARAAELRALDRALVRSESRHRALVEHAPFGIVELDGGGSVVAGNRASAELLGQSGAVAGASFVELLDGACRARFSGALARASAGETASIELSLSGPEGERWLASSFIPLEARQDCDAGVMGVIQDVTEARTLAERLEHQARVDALTGLVNRREFEARLARVLEPTLAGESEHALCFLDLDEFKLINDSCGHGAGDELLRQAGALLQGCVRRRDTLARLGGDEFGVLMEHCSSEHALRVAEQMRRVLDEFRFQWEDKAFPIRASIGLVTLDGALRNVPEALDAADRACYTAKDAGRNRIHVGTEHELADAPRVGETRWLERLHHALDDDGFSLVMQPIAANHADAEGSGRFELLVRMRGDGEAGEALPGAFLPAAQRHGLACRVDDWVVHHACDWLDGAPGRLDAVQMCGINVSAPSLLDEAFLDGLVERCSANRRLAERLCFEVSETTAVGNLAATTRFMHGLRGLGCRFALDDFGSGLSSFTYLKSLPVDYLKIDGAYIRELSANPVDRAMVRAIADIGREMGRSTVAEAVEDEDTAALTRELGVDYVQGNWIGAPQPIESYDARS